MSNENKNYNEEDFKETSENGTTNNETPEIGTTEEKKPGFLKRVIKSKKTKKILICMAIAGVTGVVIKKGKDWVTAALSSGGKTSNGDSEEDEDDEDEDDEE